MVCIIALRSHPIADYLWLLNIYANNAIILETTRKPIMHMSFCLLELLDPNSEGFGNVPVFQQLWPSLFCALFPCSVFLNPVSNIIFFDVIVRMLLDHDQRF